MKNLKIGTKLTVFTISSMMANTVKNEITIKGELDGKQYFSERGKRKKYYFKPDGETFVFEGWDIPIIIDWEMPAEMSETGFSVTSFSGNACFNFSCRNGETIEEIKQYIEEKQLNDELSEKSKASAIFVKGHGNKKVEQLIFPDLNSLRHAVVEEIKAKSLTT